jgi:hypothetical protein
MTDIGKSERHVSEAALGRTETNRGLAPHLMRYRVPPRLAWLAGEYF